MLKAAQSHTVNSRIRLSVFYSWLLSLGFAFLYFLFSQPNSLNTFSFWVGVSIATVVLLLPTSIAVTFSSKTSCASNVLFLDQVLTCGMLFLFGALGVYAREVIPLLSYIIVPVAIATVIFICVYTFQRLSYRLLLLITLIAAVQVILIINIAYFQSRGYPDVLGHLKNGQINVGHDHIYYGAVASMYDTYGVVARGINGLSQRTMYWAAEWLTAGMSNWLKANTIDASSWLFTVLLIPFLIKQALLIFERISLWVEGENPVGQSYLPILLAILLLAGTFSGVGDGLGIWHVILGQYTYNLAIGLSLVAVGVFWHCLNCDSLVQETRMTRLVKYSALVFGLPILVLLIGWAKVSIVLTVGMLFGFVWFRFKLYRRWHWTLSLCLSALMAYLAYSWFVPISYSQHQLHVQWFGFFKQYIGHMGGYIIGYFAYMWGFLLLRVIEIRRLRHKTSLQPNRYFDLELCLFMLVICVIPACLWNAGSGSSAYFIAPFRVFIIFLLMSVMYRALLNAKVTLKWCDIFSRV